VARQPVPREVEQLGAKVAITSVLHTWGSAMTHHPHVHMIVPGGGLSADASRWIACRPNFFLPVLVLSKLFRRLMLKKLVAAHTAGKLVFFGAHAYLAGDKAFAAYLAPLKRTRWFVYAKRPLAGPKAVLAYLSRYTHRVAISNRRLIAADAMGVTFKIKDYRIQGSGRYTTMTLNLAEFIRRFLLHVLPKRLPPHPPLRPSRQRRPRGEPGQGPQAARRAHARGRKQGARHARRRGRYACHPVSVLWRPHDRSRDLPGRMPARPRADHQDRHVMMLAASNHRDVGRLCRWPRAGRLGACPQRYTSRRMQPRSPADRTGQCSLT
jgi:hypothetical protein